jgi:hypothetical protein
MAAMRSYSLLAIVFSSLLAPSATAQDLPEAPGHSFWDRQNTTLFLVHAGLESTDFAITHHNLSQGGRELNPMGKSLCESGTAGQAVFFAGRTLGGMSISYAFHRTGHHKLERAFTVFMIGDSSYGVAYSFAHRR